MVATNIFAAKRTYLEFYIMRTSFHSQVEVGFVYTCTSVAYCSRVLASEVYEWSLPSTCARKYSMSVSLWLTYSQNTREWDVASERCRSLQGTFTTMIGFVIWPPYKR